MSLAGHFNRNRNDAYNSLMTRAQFDAETYAALVFTIATINTWNRIAITSHSPAGRYRSKLTASRS